MNMRRLVFLSLAATSAFVALPAWAGCRLDILCAVSESVGRGAGGGAAEGVRPLVIEVMQRMAPELILKLQAAVDHNILTAEEAGERLIGVAYSMVEKATRQADRLLQTANEEVLAAEQKLFVDASVLLEKNWDRLHCESLAVNTLLADQVAVIDSKIEGILNRVPFAGYFKSSSIEQQCRKDLGLSSDAKAAELGIMSTYKVWRCVRLSYVDPMKPALAILDAYVDIEFHGAGVVCALRGSPTALQVATDIWNDDEIRAKTWRQEINGS